MDSKGHQTGAVERRIDATAIAPSLAGLDTEAIASGDKARRLILDVLSRPEVRSAFYENPFEIATRYGLTLAEGEAFATVKASLVNALGVEQLGALNALLATDARYAPMDPAPCSPNCTPRVTGGCPPGCNPDAMKE